MALTIKQALKNIDVVVANVQMKRQEHAALQESVFIVTQRCKVADDLEKENRKSKKSRPKEKKDIK